MLAAHLDLLLVLHLLLDFEEIPGPLQYPYGATFSCKEDGSKGGGKKAGTQDIQGGKRRRRRAVGGLHLEAVSGLDDSSISGAPDHAGEFT